jgi:hypothetical protein
MPWRRTVARSGAIARQVSSAAWIANPGRRIGRALHIKGSARSAKTSLSVEQRPDQATIDRPRGRFGIDLNEQKAPMLAPQSALPKRVIGT